MAGSDRHRPTAEAGFALHQAGRLREAAAIYGQLLKSNPRQPEVLHLLAVAVHQMGDSRAAEPLLRAAIGLNPRRSEEHTSELQSLMRNSYAVFCLKKKKI